MHKTEEFVYFGFIGNAFRRLRNVRPAGNAAARAGNAAQTMQPKKGKLLENVINVAAAASTPVGLAGFFIADKGTRVQEQNIKRQEELAARLQEDPTLKAAMSNSIDKGVRKQLVQPPALPPNSLAHQKRIIER